MKRNRSMRRTSLTHAIRQALQHRSSIDEFTFHMGYQGVYFPRLIRRVFARTKLHRSWLSGYTGLGILSIIELTMPVNDEEVRY